MGKFNLQQEFAKVAIKKVKSIASTVATDEEMAAATFTYDKDKGTVGIDNISEELKEKIQDAIAKEK